MPIVIGTKQESDFSDPIGMLGDCHRRIERFLGVLQKLAAEQRGASLTDAERAALQTSLRYFRDAAPKHTADEEESLFPRMRKTGDPGTQMLLDRITTLESDHKIAEAAHDEVNALGQTWLSRGHLNPAEASRLSALLGQLVTLYARQIALEDSDVFPTAVRLLSPADRRAIGLEMASRRGLRSM